MSTTETFHLFPYLPWELRAMIWEFTVKPRRVDVRVVCPVQGTLRRELRSVNRVPEILQVCKQSRYLGVYKQAFTEIPLGISDFQRKYVWINWEYDTILAGMTELRHFKYESIQTSIQRLDIEIPRLLPGEIKILQGFAKLKKLDIHGEIWNFRWAFRLFPLACGQKDIILHDMLDSLTLNSWIWDELWDDLWEGDMSVYV